MDGAGRPETWNRIQVDPSRTGQERQPVPGIIGVTQRLMLFKDEWMCVSCQAVIQSDGSGYYMTHGDGCEQVATMTEVQPRR